MILRASDIACARGGRQIFANFTLILNAGESVLLQGPNGVGKSSLLRLVSGLICCNKGIIENRERVALADEHLALDTGKRLGDALGFWARIDGVEQAPLDAALAHFALKPLADIPVRMLSTGQRKRAILARVMASGAALWLLRETGWTVLRLRRWARRWMRIWQAAGQSSLHRISTCHMISRAGST